MPTYERKQQIQSILFSSKVAKFSTQAIIEKLTQNSLVSLQQLMQQYPLFKVTQFLRFFMKIIPHKQQQQIYLAFGLFKLFKDICRIYKATQIGFIEISSLITQKIPQIDEDVKLKQKILPIHLDFSDQIRKKLIPPDIQGKKLQQRIRLNDKSFKHDLRHHINRRIGQAFYSKKANIFFEIDFPGTQVNLLNANFDTIKSLKTQLEVSKRDSVISCIAWSQTQGRIACLLKNLSISLWAKDDDFRFEVNIPLPTKYLITPYVSIHYMESSRIWFTLDSKATIFILSSYNFQPIYEFKHSKIIKKRETEKIQIVEMKYRKLICLIFQRSLFIVSLQKRQLMTQLSSFSTSLTSVCFSEAYQALFCSTYGSYFTSYQLSQHLDFIQKGIFQGHKSTITMLGTIQNRPIIISLQQSALIKLWDIRDFHCYQSFYVLKNIQFHQMLYLPDSLCLVGSKMYLYKWESQNFYREPEKILVLTTSQNQLLLVTNKSIKLISFQTGSVIKIITGIFDADDIYYATHIEEKRRLFICNEQGSLLIYNAADLVLLHVKQIQPRPIYFHYDYISDLISYCCMGNIFIGEFDVDNSLKIRRKIINEETIIKYVNISQKHDIICVSYDNDQNVYFYTYQKCKAIGFLHMPQLIKIMYLPNVSLIIFLQTKQLRIFSYKKSSTSISFFEYFVFDLWESQLLINNGVPKSQSKVSSGDIILLGDNLFLISTDASIITVLQIDFNLMKTQILPKFTQNYNPYRISIEQHNQAFALANKSVVIKQHLKLNINEKTKYHKRGDLISSGKLDDFFFILNSNNQLFIIKSDLNVIGQISLSYTLPKLWNVKYYTENDFKQLEFVLDFIENQRSLMMEFSNVTQPLPKINSQKELPIEKITLTSLLQQDSHINAKLRQYKSCSLRQKKILLEKQREQRGKMEDFLERRKLEQQKINKWDNKKVSEKQVIDAVTYFSADYSQMLLKKGINTQLPLQIKNLDRKLNNVIMKDQKKSVVSKISKMSGIKSNSGLLKTPQIRTQRLKSILQIVNDKKKNYNYNSSKNIIKQLNEDLRLSKTKGIRILRQNSLPFLKRKHDLQ